MANRICILDRSRGILAIRLMLVVMSGWIAANPPSARAEAAASTEYQVKAACLLNFVQFIQWPAGSFAAADTPITVGVLGDDPFGDVLEKTFEGQLIGGRKLALKRSAQIDEMKTCHLVFICKSEKDRLGDILKSFRDLSIVTVGENSGFASRGGIINFYLESKKVRFEINAEAAERKELKISSQLLKRAKIVSGR